jgi:hypothetical protein
MSNKSENEKNERIFRELPKLTSPEYLQRLKAASTKELPAPVLVRAFRELMTVAGDDPTRLSRPAEATLARLLSDKYEAVYFRALRHEARRIHSENDWFDLGDLIFQSKQEVGLVLVSDRGANAHESWASFQIQRVQDAWRELNGRRGERKEPERGTPPIDKETGEPADLTDVSGEEAPWHGHVRPDKEGWLRDFALRTAAKIENPNIRGVALNQWGDNPSKISSLDPDDTTTLEHRYGVDRFTIRRWKKTALGLLLAALKKQDEMDIDTGWLEL